MIKAALDTGEHDHRKCKNKPKIDIPRGPTHPGLELRKAATSKGFSLVELQVPNTIIIAAGKI